MTDIPLAKDATIHCIPEGQEEEHPINLLFKWQMLSISPQNARCRRLRLAMFSPMQAAVEDLIQIPGVLLPSVKPIPSVATIHPQGTMHAVTVLEAALEVL